MSSPLHIKREKVPESATTNKGRQQEISPDNSLDVFVDLRNQSGEFTSVAIRSRRGDFSGLALNYLG